jgi:hypothetical protein
MLSEAFGYQHNKPYYDMLKLQGMTMAKRELIFRIFLESDAKFFEKLISVRLFLDWKRGDYEDRKKGCAMIVRKLVVS